MICTSVERPFPTRMLIIFRLFRLEVRGWIFTATTMVWPSFAVLEPKQVWFSKCYSPPRGYLGPGHVFHHARRFQSIANTSTLFSEDLQERQCPLFNEVIITVHNHSHPAPFQLSNMGYLTDLQSFAVELLVCPYSCSTIGFPAYSLADPDR